MSAIPELTKACKLNDRIQAAKVTTVEDEHRRRALWLAAVAKGATRVQIQEQCGISASFLEGELRKARTETTDPALKRARLPHRGLTLGEFWCPEKGCTRAKGNGNEALSSSQALAMHRVKMHDYRLGENRLTATMVRKARKSKKSTRDLAREFGVSYHALRAARSGKTWKSTV